MIKSLPLAENLELDGACRCASQWLQRWNNMTFWPRLRRRHEDEVLVFNAQLAQVLGLDRKWLLGLLPTERGFQIFPSYFHHFWLSCNNMGFWQNTVFGCGPSWAQIDHKLNSRPLETRRKPRNWWQSKLDVRALFTCQVLRSCYLCYLLDGMVPMVPFPVLIEFWSLLVVIGTLFLPKSPTTLLNAIAQLTLSHIVAFWLACWNTSIRVNKRCGGPEIKHVQDVGTSK